jgi:ATP phosphoribosyltransferase regulatory subunit HisZ
MTQEAHSSSGIIFRGPALGAGQPILSGGRYDGLTARYGRALPAVGFALSTKLLMIALERQGSSFSLPRLDWLIACGEDTVRAAAEKAGELRRAGQSAAFLYGEGEEAVRSRLRRGEAEGALLFTGAGVTVIKREEA